MASFNKDYSDRIPWEVTCTLGGKEMGKKRSAASAAQTAIRQQAVRAQWTQKYRNISNATHSKARAKHLSGWEVKTQCKDGTAARNDYSANVHALLAPCQDGVNVLGIGHLWYDFTQWR